MRNSSKTTRNDHPITYPNSKIYIGKDLTDSINYLGSADGSITGKGFTSKEMNLKEVEYITSLKSNDPAIGYNQWPKLKSSVT